MSKAPKTGMSAAGWVAIGCLVIYTDSILDFIPIFFAESGTRFIFHLLLFILFIPLVSYLTHRHFYSPVKLKAPLLASIASGALVLTTFLLFGFWTIIMWFGFWTDAYTLYTNKQYSSIKIVGWSFSSYDNEMLPEDIHNKLLIPLPPLFKTALPIDTATIDKTHWIKSNEGDESKFRTAN